MSRPLPHRTMAQGAAPAPLLPRLLLLSDRSQAAGPLVEVVAAAVDAGCRFVVLREKDLPEQERATLAEQLAPVVQGAGGWLLAAGAPLPGCDGVHLPRPRPRAAGPPGLGVVGRSCHDQAELGLAAAEGVSYVTISPVLPTASKPGYGPALGMAGLAALCASSQVPVLALGGIETGAQAAACLAAGAHGVAVMGAVMRADDPGRITADLLAGLSGAADPGRVTTGRRP